MGNRLVKESSPYLLQHTDNPVDWYPWGHEALERARREDRPILLSIGYFSCHWCHVMAEESFADPQVADIMNDEFVNIKVDREERPDLDQVYQRAHLLLTGRPGGWPLTMFLAPELVPFFGGTYFPKLPRHGLAGFSQILRRVAEACRSQPQAISEQSQRLLEAMAEEHQRPAASVPGEELIGEALSQLKAEFDPVHGGFGGAPKFPRPVHLELALRLGDAEAKEQALLTLGKMAGGGLFDQLAGGFFRYSVDDGWTIPHFRASSIPRWTPTPATRRVVTMFGAEKSCAPSSTPGSTRWRPGAGASTGRRISRARNGTRQAAPRWKSWPASWVYRPRRRPG